MGNRLGKLIGVAAIALALARLDRLLEPSIESPPWQVVLIGAAVLGGLLTWAMSAARLGVWARLSITGAALFLLLARIVAPGELIVGLLPGPDAFEEARLQVGIAAELIRFGAAPVLPVPGLTAVLAALFWLLGALVAGSRGGLRALPALVVYLQFATLDRRPPGLGWIIAFVVVGAAALVSLVPAATSTMGRTRTPSGELVPRRSTSLLVSTLLAATMVGVTAGSAMAAFIPESGLLAWRTQSGIGSGLYGSGSFNLFVGLQQSLVELSDEPMFYARVSESAPPNREIYWKLITLDVFDGELWAASDQSFAKGGNPRWEQPEWEFQGPTTRVAANIRIAGLSGQYLPSLYSPVGLTSDEPLITESFRVRQDGSIAVDLQVIDDWTYQLDADLPVPDIAALATRNGALSPMFQTAAEAGVFGATPQEASDSTRPESLSDYTSLPSSVSDELRSLARDLVSGGSTPFERALLLEAYFRDPGQFTYSTGVDTGHSSLDLEDWLTDPDSRNYRTGYCEQFATAMGVLARAIGIPSRVVLGFTPGDVETQADGSEVVVVRENNAHAWVELWMDGQGWVRFDPTPRSDGINPSLTGDEVGFDPRSYLPAPGETGAGSESPAASVTPDRLDEGEEFLPGPQATTGGAAGVDRPSWLWLIPLVGLAVMSIPVYKLMRRRRRLTRISDGDVATAWKEIVDRLADLGTKVDPAQTPLEIARRESADLVPLARLYSAAAYGERGTVACLEEFTRAEDGLRRRYDRRRWRTSWLRRASLRR
jgi:hypothetical protein